MLSVAWTTSLRRGISANPLINVFSGKGLKAITHLGSTPSVFPEASSFNRWIKQLPMIASKPNNFFFVR